MLLSKFHLNLEATALCSGHDLTWIEVRFGEPLAAFNSSYSDVGAEVQICRKFPLGHGNFKRPSARYGGNSISASQSYFRPRRVFIRDHPARHGDLEDRHQVGALL